MIYNRLNSTPYALYIYYSVSYLLRYAYETGIHLTFILTFLAHKFSLALFNLFHTFITPFIKTVTTNLIENLKLCLSNLI